MALHPRLAPLLFVLLTVGCPKDEKKDAPSSTSEKESKDDGKKKKEEGKDKKEKDEGKDGKSDKTDKKKGDDQAAGAKGDDAPPSSGHTLAGVDVPAWATPSAAGKCTLSKDDTQQLDTLKKGDDGGAGFDDGKGDVAALITPLKKSCATASTMVSQALNAGGYTRYAKKQYAKADGWFARALVADPTNTFARYNLACNLALEGKSEESLWNLEQLVPAEKAGDPRALHYLTKAKSDSDLVSVRKDPRFTAATAHGEPKGGLIPCPDGQVHTKDACIQVCSSYGTQAGCPPGQACGGAMSFGAGLVPFCADTFECKDAEERMFPVPDGEMSPAVNAKPGCFINCGGNDDQCPKGQKCSGVAAEPTMFSGWLVFNVCK